MKLPARVRVTCPPLPLAKALADSAKRLCPSAELSSATKIAIAIAGGSVIGIHLKGGGGTECALEAGWRGRGIEEALLQALEDQ